MATSPGRGGGSWVLNIAKEAFPHYGANIVGTFSLPSFNENFDTKKMEISNPELDNQLKDIIKNF